MPETRKQLLDRVTELIDACLAIDFQIPVDTGFFSVDRELVRRIEGLLETTAELMADVAWYFEEQCRTAEEEIQAADDADFLREIGASISTELASQEVADLAYVGRAEMLDIQRELGAAKAHGNVWTIAGQAEAGASRAARALIPIESAMRDYEGLPPQKRRWANLEDSLEIRRQYGILWRSVVRSGEPEGARIEAELKRVASRIKILRHLKIYPFLRIDDRLQIRKLQKRILAHLTGDGDGSTAEQLWSDTVAFFSLLMQVNHRAELREHDRQLVIELAGELRNKRPLEQEIPRRILVRLEPLLGRDEDLDQILLDPDAHCLGDCLPPLERLKRQLADPPPVATANLGSASTA